MNFPWEDMREEKLSQNSERTHNDFPGGKNIRTDQIFQESYIYISKFCNSRYDFLGDHTPRTDIL